MSAFKAKLKIFFAAVFAVSFTMSENVLAVELDKLTLEEAAYYRTVGGSAKPSKRNWKAQYLKQLSPGGRAYFLACRRDYREALQELEKVPRRNTGSYFYVKAFCLEGLGRHAEAVKNYEAARAKIGEVFHPGFRFYLQCATANMKVGNEGRSLADLDAAGPISEEYAQVHAYPRYVREEISKRKVAVIEYKGRYKEAAEKYMKLFNAISDQFHLNEPLTGDAASKAQASAWLEKLVEPSSFKSETEQCIFFLRKGKANLSLGNIAQAKTYLAKAAQCQSHNRELISPERFKYEDMTVLSRVKDQAKSLLVRIYYKEKDYRKCCEYLRCLFRNEVMDSLETTYNTIAMHDIPELVVQKDIDQHIPSLELKLDKADLLIFEKPAQARR